MAEFWGTTDRFSRALHGSRPLTFVAQRWRLNACLVYSTYIIFSLRIKYCRKFLTVHRINSEALRSFVSGPRSIVFIVSFV